MAYLIRREEPADHNQVFSLIEQAFRNEAPSDHQEQFLVDRLRKSNSFVPELSLVALEGETIVGHILLTKIQIENPHNSFESLALAPVAVLPSFQGKGIGGLLIEESHKIARSLGFKSIVLLGHQDYYPRFGYQQADQFGISLPFEVPKENCMAIELVEGALNKVHGVVKYDPAFFE